MARRYGDGSVFQRSRDGKWVATWEVGEDGKRRRRSVVADTAGAAIRRMREAQRSGASSNSVSRPRIGSVGEYLDRWLVEVVRRTRRERTFVGYRSIAEGLPPAFLATDLADLEPHDVQVMVNGLDLAPRTVSHYAAMLRTAFAYAVRRGIIDRNPATDIDLPAIRRTERIPLTAAELRTFLDASREDPLYPLWATAAWTGMRQGEILGLRWEDVSLTRANINVRTSLSRLPPKRRTDKGWRYELTEPKTNRSRRLVPLVPAVVDALTPMRKAYLASPPPLDQGLVFATPAGSPLDGPTITRLFQAALRKAGVRVVRFHDTRHGAASMLIELGVDLATVSAILGHSNIGTTVDLYGHLTESHKRSAMARLEGVG
jgi:integrase